MTMAEYFPFPDYVGLFRMLIFELPEYYRTEPSEGTWKELGMYSHITWGEIQMALMMAVLWTIVRTLLTVVIFKVRFKGTR